MYPGISTQKSRLYWWVEYVTAVVLDSRNETVSSSCTPLSSYYVPRTNKEVLGYLFQRSNGGLQKVDDVRPSAPFVGSTRDIRPVILLQRTGVTTIERRSRTETKEDRLTESAEVKPFSKFGVIFPLPHDHLDDIFLSCGGID
jgi:hypothetical protein